MPRWKKLTWRASTPEEKADYRRFADEHARDIREIESAFFWHSIFSEEPHDDGGLGTLVGSIVDHEKS